MPASTNAVRLSRMAGLPCSAALVFVLLGLSSLARGEVGLPVGDSLEPLVVRGDAARRWQQGEYEVVHVQGHCEVSQGSLTARAEEAVLWIEQGDPLRGQPTKVIAYLERGQDYPVRVDYWQSGAAQADPDAAPAAGASAAGASPGREASYVGKTWLGRFQTNADVQIHAATVGGKSPEVNLVDRGLEAREAERREAVRQAGFADADGKRDAEVQPAQATFQDQGFPVTPPVSSGRRIRISPRSGGRIEANLITDPTRNESIAFITKGVQAVVEGIEVSNVGDLGRVVIETDKMVIWGPNVQELIAGGQVRQSDTVPVELYLEGNVVFRQGDRVIYAERMYYDVARETGLVLQAEILTPVPDYEGLLRLKAEVLQMLDRHNFQAYGGAITSSRLGVPRYWLQSENVTFRDIQTLATEPTTGQVQLDPRTGEPLVDHELRATSRNSFVYIGGVPVFYWPYVSTDLTKPSYFIDRFSVKNDSVFGTQVLVDLDAYQLFGINEPPDGTELTVSADYLSERGFGYGSNFSYERDGLLGHPGPVRGVLDGWAISDQGLDNLGADRRSIQPEREFRGRVFGQHRHNLLNGLQITGEAGYISDRNFLEQYFEQEWDQNKDQTTGVELKQFFDHGTLSVTSDVRLNDFFTQTEWLPRGDHFTLGRSFLEHIQWFEHSHVGYARLKTADLPPAGLQPPQASLPWETDPLGIRYDDRTGLRAASRQELDIPLQLGPVKLVPYGLGEIAQWSEDRNADDVTRLYGQAGVRTSLPLWAAYPDVQSTLLNLNGLAHKISFDTDVFYADASEDLDRLPLYDPLDDDAQEMYQRMFINDTYAGTLPAKFDARNYALRSAAQGWVTGPTEIADDLFVARAGIRQRWQTRRGLPGRERVVDWITLDFQGTVFPEADRDNFGSDVGLLSYDFRWHLGDRLTLLSDGLADVFGDALRKFSVGTLMSRPGVGNLYFGYRTVQGPFTADVLSASASYRMSEKWIVSGGASLDLGPTGNIGQTLSFTRIGESFLIRGGFNADVSRGNIGAVFAVEPRFLSFSRLGRIGGVQIPPAGAFGLE